jgi:hypothetical protein
MDQALKIRLDECKSDIKSYEGKLSALRRSL